jgi:uncharacterized protein
VAEAQHGQILRLVLDTNIVVSALLWRGAPFRLLRLSGEQAAITLFTSGPLLNELRNTLNYPKFAKRIASTESSVEELVAFYSALATAIEPVPGQSWVPRDKDDDAVVAAAVGANAHAIISGDTDLTELREVAGIDVLRASEAIELIARAS